MSARSFVLTKRRQGNITIERSKLALICVLHKTHICRLVGNQVQLQSGGWQTVTTKQAMNRFLTLNNFTHTIHLVKGIWYVSNRGLTYEYHDGMILIKD